MMKKIDGQDLVVLTPAEYKEISKPYIVLGKMANERKKTLELQLRSDIERMKAETEIKKNTIIPDLWRTLLGRMRLE